MPDNLPLMPVY